MTEIDFKKNYITSDLHFYHNNIIKYAERKEYQPFSDEKTKRMNWDIVNSINTQVPDEKGIVLWNLGDVFYGRLFSQQPLENLKRLISVMKGKHRKLNLILGNHDFQFKKWANWQKLYPLNAQSSLQTIFQNCGFDVVYDIPILIENKYILSHEPVFLKPGSQFINIHGHTHQKILKDSDDFTSKFFCYDLENYKMVLKAYKDSGREIPPMSLKKDWENWLVNCKNYFNACWDYQNYKVRSFESIKKELENNYKGQS